MHFTHINTCTYIINTNDSLLKDQIYLSEVPWRWNFHWRTADPWDLVPPPLQERFLLDPKRHENRPQSSANDHNSFLGAISPQISSQVDNSRRSEEAVTTIDAMVRVVWTRKAECRNKGRGKFCTTDAASPQSKNARYDWPCYSWN